MISVGGELSAEFVSTPRIDWQLGPFDPRLPGAFRLSIRSDGDVISSASVKLGYSRRGVEPILRRLPWNQGITVISRLDPEAGVFGEWVYSIAVEKALGLSVSERAQSIRVLLAELSRISCHLRQLALVSRAAGSESVFHFMLREREHALDLMELATGSRHAPVFIRPGGVRQDVSEGFLERLQAVCQRVLDRISEYNDQLTYNEAFVRRVSGVGVISQQMVAEHRISGIPAKAFDPSVDLRWQGSPGYDLIHHREIRASRILGTQGDLHHRFVLKLQEVIQSAQLLRELSQHVPQGEFCASCDWTVIPRGEFSAEVEAPRGRLAVAIVSSGGKSPERVEFRTPSEALFDALPEFLVGVAHEDLALALSSLDIEVAEVDR